MQEQSEQQDDVCQQCGQTFQSAEDLEHHIQLAHASE
jgi:hypothetical protein